MNSKLQCDRKPIETICHLADGTELIVTVWAWVYNCWAVNRAWTTQHRLSDFYVITHLPSGMCLPCRFLETRTDEACAAIIAIDRLRNDWGVTGTLHEVLHVKPIHPHAREINKIILDNGGTLPGKEVFISTSDAMPERRNGFKELPQ